MPETDEQPRIVAVVVTHNRRALLARLLPAIAAGDVRPHEVIVVDNASTDGTAAFVGSQAWGVPVHLVALSENTGGAGGFRSGTHTAIARGADLVWLMDDDGVPAADCLSTLLDHIHDHDFIGPVVVDESDPGELVFPIRVPGSSSVLHTVTEVQHRSTGGLLADVVIPFNGVLLRRSLVGTIGEPRAEFFIWGDDVEYLWRAQQAGARIATVVAARFAHPSVGDLGTPTLLGQTYNHSPSDLKAYCMARNNWVNLRTYRGLPQALAFVAKTIWFYTVTRPDLSRLRLMGQGIRAGMRHDFSGHRRFLP